MVNRYMNNMHNKPKTALFPVNNVGERNEMIEIKKVLVDQLKQNQRNSTKHFTENSAVWLYFNILIHYEIALIKIKNENIKLKWKWI